MSNQQPLKGLRALVVEDEYFIADDLKRVLKKQGADTVRMSGSIDDALTQIRVDQFGFALLDINIRGEDAFIVADAFLKSKLPFAFVTGYNRASIPPRYGKVPNWGKPYNDRQIVSGIQALWTPSITA